MIGPPLHTREAIDLNLSLAVRALLSQPVDRLLIRHYLREALRFSFWAAQLNFFEGEYSEWLTLTTEAAANLVSDATKIAPYVPPLVAFLEVSVNCVVDAHLRRLASQPTGSRQQFVIMVE